MPGLLSKLGRWLKILVLGTILLGLMLWLGGVFRSDHVDPDGPGRGRRPAEKERVAVRVVPLTLEEVFEGQVRSKRTTLLSARISAPILTLTPRVGDRVDPADEEAIGRLDDSQVKAQLAIAKAALEASRLSTLAAREGEVAARARKEAAEADLELARREFGRVEALVNRGSATSSDLDVVTARRKKAEKAVEEAQAAIELAKRRIAESQGLEAVRQAEVELATTNLKYAELRPEVGGRVVRRLMEPGSQATPGQPYLEIDDPRSLQLEVLVRESVAAQLAGARPSTPRRTFPVTLPAVGSERGDLEAAIDEIVPAAEAGSRTLRVRFLIPPERAEGILPGMSGQVRLPTGKREVLALPASALIRVGQLRYVDVVTGDHLTRRLVRVGRELPEGHVEILDGVSRGEEVQL